MAQMTRHWSYSNGAPMAHNGTNSFRVKESE